MSKQLLVGRVFNPSLRSDGWKSHPTCSISQRLRQRRGTVLVETALLLPIFLLFVFGIFEYGQFLMVRNLIDHAAREGARYAVVRADDDLTQTQDIIDYVEDRMASLDNEMTGLNVQIYEADPSTGANIGSWRDAAFGETIAVEITGDYQPFTASFFFMPDSIPLTARSIMKCEAN